MLPSLTNLTAVRLNASRGWKNSHEREGVGVSFKPTSSAALFVAKPDTHFTTEPVQHRFNQDFLVGPAGIEPATEGV